MRVNCFSVSDGDTLTVMSMNRLPTPRSCRIVARNPRREFPTPWVRASVKWSYSSAMVTSVSLCVLGMCGSCMGRCNG